MQKLNFIRDAWQNYIRVNRYIKLCIIIFHRRALFHNVDIQFSVSIYLHHIQVQTKW